MHGLKNARAIPMAHALEAGLELYSTQTTDSKGLWRRDRDSNPGYLAVYTLSKRAPSATRPSLRSRT
jgi:hypothetical protein